MEIQTILNFLQQLKENNNREWFNENKKQYLESKEIFENLVAKLILKVGEFDEEVKYLTPSQCVFRIYRDVRFSPDKSPYKTHFGAYIAPNGGRKSRLSGYYIHLEPGNSQLGGGIYCPEPDDLKKIRQSIYENYDELEEILHEKKFKANFGEIYSPESLKKTPVGYPADFEGVKLLKFKHFLVEHSLNDSALSKENFVEYAASVFKTQLPLNRFLNYVFLNEE